MNNITIPAKLTSQTVTEVLHILLGQLDDKLPLTINLCHIEVIDSSGIALLVHLKSKYKNISFINHTAKIITLCGLYKITL